MQSKFIGPEQHPMQIDESYFAGKRKYKKGRILHGHGKDMKELDDDSGELLYWGTSSRNRDEDDDDETYGHDDSR